ncbi:MAG: hypothetical protein GWP91_20825 [Rhodobacterales bacterium]|nr:hypothetical protein [Rhodobacterales bacterium]
MYDTPPKHHEEAPLDPIETSLDEVGAESVPTLGEALDAYRPPPEPEPVDPAVKQRVYLLAAVLSGVGLASVIGGLIAGGLQIFG